MKHLIPFRLPLTRLLVVSAMLLAFFSCQDTVENTYTYHTTVSIPMKAEDLRNMYVGPVAPKTIEKTGKIYLFGNYLFISEPNKGIHVIDNSDPANPVNISFVEIPGTADLAINDHILYADSYIDLLAFDISYPKKIRLASREQDVFMNYYTNPEIGVFYFQKDTIITTTNPQRGWAGPILWFESASMDFYTGGGNYGQGGSMARFTLANGHLYAVDDYDLRLFDVSKKADPEFVKQINLGWGIETIFPFKDKLFIGSNTGMHIYDISSPAAPEQLSVYSHITSCDPVVANDDYAFVTL